MSDVRQRKQMVGVACDDTIAYYEAMARAYFESAAAVVLSDKIGAFVARLPGKRVLDAGCGPGHDAIHLSRCGLGCIGIDLSREMIAIATEQAARVWSKARFRLMDVLDTDFEKDSFDGVWCSSVFVHLRETAVQRLLSDLRRILSQNGILGIITAGRYERIATKGDTREYFMYSRADLERLLSLAGFRALVEEDFRYGGKPRIFIIASKIGLRNACYA